MTPPTVTDSTSAPAATDALTAFHWEPQPAAEAWLQKLVAGFLEQMPAARAFAERLHREAGVRFIDMVANVSIDRDLPEARGLREAGWSETSADLFTNTSGIFPPVSLGDHGTVSLGMKVESVADFLAANSLTREIQGDPLASYRWALIEDHHTSEWYAVERHGSRHFSSGGEPEDAVKVLATLERFRTRPRNFSREPAGFELAGRLIAEGISEVGQDYACDLFFAAEREYWQRRNRAAQVQKARQDRLGIGWANHDHHTYRSSRRHFARMIGIFEELGFHCRERFYAGREAGWGAQVLEQPNSGIVIFADVDLSPDELLIDFAHEPLPERDKLGTVGLWCALHGESFLEAGMHHLECTFEFEALKAQLESEHGIPIMKPFTDFPYLRQAFTQGERWPVRGERIDALLASGRITDEQAEKFRAEGAIGSHMENLERNQGFKGFNQTGVSEIISATDPRKQ